MSSQTPASKSQIRAAALANAVLDAAGFEASGELDRALWAAQDAMLITFNPSMEGLTTAATVALQLADAVEDAAPEFAAEVARTRRMAGSVQEYAAGVARQVTVFRAASDALRA